ncbi:MAG: hypothetical protein H0W75_10520 [Chitinophagaceae bacterium]|nr:hypothetical protein [Chitinophagaceae bacterium]
MHKACVLEAIGEVMICAPALHNVIIRKALQHPGNKKEMLLRSEFIIPHYVNAG